MVNLSAVTTVERPKYRIQLITAKAVQVATDEKTVDGQSKKGRMKIEIQTVTWPRRVEYNWPLQQDMDAALFRFKDWLLSMDDDEQHKPTTDEFSDDGDFAIMLAQTKEFVVKESTDDTNGVRSQLLLRKVKVDGREEFRVVVPRKIRTLLTLDVHNQTHRAAKVIVTEIATKYWWPHMTEEITAIVDGCPSCQQNKPLTGATRAPLQQFDFMEPFAYVAMDVIGPLPDSTSGHKYILTMVDMATRWVEAVPLREISAQTIANAFFIEWCCRYGPPQQVLTDQGSNFESKLFAAFCRMLNIAKERTSGYRPQANGRCERVNGLLERYIQLIGHRYRRQWNLVLPYALYAVRRAVNSTTGYAPAEMVFGRPGPTAMLVDDPSDEVLNNEQTEQLIRDSAESWVRTLCDRLKYIHQKAIEIEEKHRAAFKHQYDKHTSRRTFNPGEKVWLLERRRDHDKF